MHARSSSSTRSASPRRRQSPISSAAPSSGSARACRCTSTATTTSGSRPPRRSPPCAPAPSWIHGTINGMGERAGNANLGEVALTLRALYGVESNLRLDRVRETSSRVQALSGYALEPWKPVTGETLFRRESGAVAGQFHDPPSIEPYSSTLVAAERGIVLGKKSGLDSIRIKAEELGLDVPEERHAELLAQVKELGTRKRGLVTDDEFRSSSMADYDAVLVGSGVNSLACGGAARARRLERVRARAERLARRRDPHGRDHRARVPPRRLQCLAPALGGRRGARAAGRGARARAGSSTSTPSCRRPRPSRTARRRSCSASADAERSGVRAARPRRRRRRGAHARRVLPERRPRVRPARHRALGKPGPGARRRKALRRLGRGGLRVVHRRACSCRAATGSSGRLRPTVCTACSLPGCFTPASGPTPRRPAS